MPRRGRAISRALSAWSSIAFLRISRFLPLACVKAFMLGLGRLAFWVVPRIRKVGMANLNLAYGDTLSRSEKLRILRGVVRNVAIVAAEFSRTPEVAAARRAHCFDVSGLEHLQQDRQPFFISAHLGNWEWIAPAMSTQGFRVVEVVRELDHPRLNREVDALRASSPTMRTLTKNDAARKIMRFVRDGWVVGILADQSPRENAVPVTFFGQPCWASAAPAIIAARLNVNIHPMSIVRQPDDRYHIRFYPALALAHTGDFRADLLENSQRCQDALEEIVRAHPEQWLWLHRRWKARPALEAKWRSRPSR